VRYDNNERNSKTGLRERGRALHDTRRRNRNGRKMGYLELPRVQYWRLNRKNVRLNGRSHRCCKERPGETPHDESQSLTRTGAEEFVLTFPVAFVMPQ